mmetsp:Transcript_36818/g.118757  ORF Transcript_36818/g.118757 Transcript_36818/m.118757 type:complete len:156 (-) Transcript_36818:205-672(-)
MARLCSVMLFVCFAAAAESQEAGNATDATQAKASLRGAADAVLALAGTTGRACIGQLDSHWLSQYLLGWCGRYTGGAMPAAGQCMTDFHGVSESCGNCLGDLIQCARHSCEKECCSGQCEWSSECSDCNQAHCNGAFSACAGESPPMRIGLVISA